MYSGGLPNWHSGQRRHIESLLRNSADKSSSDPGGKLFRSAAENVVGVDFDLSFKSADEL